MSSYTIDTLRFLGDLRIFSIVLVLELIVVSLTIAFLLRLRGLRRELEQANTVLLRRDDGKTPSEVMELLPEFIRDDFEVWRPSFVETGNQSYRPEDCTTFLDHDRVLGRVTALRFVSPQFAEHLGSTATGLGILGTFIGVALALGQIEVNETSLTASIPLVISKLASAFTTSIIGVFAAIFINLSQSSGFDRFQATVDRTNDHLCARFPSLSPSRILLDLREDSRLNTEALEETKESMQIVADRVVENLTKGFESSLQAQLGPALESITKMVREQTESASASATDTVKNLTDVMLSELGGSFEAMGRGIDSATGRMTSMLERVEGLVQNVDASLLAQGEVVAKQTDSIRQAGLLAVDSNKQLEQASRTVERLSELGAQFEGVRTFMAKSLEDQVEQRSEMDKRSARVVQMIVEAGKGYQASAQELSTLGPELRATIEEGARQLQSTGAELVAATRSMQGVLAGVTNDAARVAEQFKQASTTLEQRITGEQALLLEYGETHRKLSESLGHAEPVIAELAKSVQEAARRDEAANRLVEQLGASVKKVSEAAQSLRDGLGESAGLLERAAKSVSESARNQEAWQTSANQAVRQFATELGEAVRNSLNELDGSLTRSVEALSTAINALEDVVEDTVALAERKAMGR